jgi:hypothetical protein
LIAILTLTILAMVKKHKKYCEENAASV